MEFALMAFRPEGHDDMICLSRKDLAGFESIEEALFSCL
jgi:hypothetical protein